MTVRVDVHLSDYLPRVVVRLARPDDQDVIRGLCRELYRARAEVRS